MVAGGDAPSAWALVVLPFVGTIAGAFIGLLGVRLQLRNQEAARKAVRLDAARDRQRAALEALQEAVNEFAVVRMPEVGADTLTGSSRAVDGALGLLGRVQLAIARVHDEQTRQLADLICQIALQYLDVTSREEILTVTGQLRDSIGAMHERVGMLLRELNEPAA